jgi:hypothetical protein
MSWSFRNKDGAGWLHVLGAAGIVSVFFAWPHTIHFDSDRIWQRDRLGRSKNIGWSEVDSLAYDVAHGQATVGGGNVQIVHNFLHSDKKAFCELIEQRTSVHLAEGVWPSEAVRKLHEPGEPS